MPDLVELAGIVRSRNGLVEQARSTMLEIVASIGKLTQIIANENQSSVEQVAEVGGTAASIKAMDSPTRRMRFS